MNVLGMRTLLQKELRRFMRAPIQTLLQPALHTVLYLMVFGFALGQRLPSVDGVPYVRFLIPGLILQALTSNALFSTSGSMFSSKMQGTLVDLLLAPLTTFEILCSYVAAALIRSSMIAVAVWAVSAMFTSAVVPHPGWLLAYSLMVGTTFALAGVILAIVSDDFEQLNLIPSFVIVPLTFLGGVFYSAEMLPQPLGTITKLNPIYYMVDGLRYGLIGRSGSDIWLGFALVSGLTLALALIAWSLIETGYKLRD